MKVLECLKLLFGLKALYWTVCRNEKDPGVACLCFSKSTTHQAKKHCDWTGFCRVRKRYFPPLRSSIELLVIGNMKRFAISSPVLTLKSKVSPSFDPQKTKLHLSGANLTVHYY